MEQNGIINGIDELLENAILSSEHEPNSSILIGLRARDLAHENNYLIGELRALLITAKSCIYSKRYIEALSYFNQVYAMASTNVYISYKYDALIGIARIFSMVGLYNNAKTYYEEAGSLIKKDIEHDMFLKYMKEFVSFLFTIQQDHLIITLIDNEIEQIKEYQNYETIIIPFLFSKARALYNTNNQIEAIRLYKLIIEKTEIENPPQERCLSFFELAKNSRARDSIADALTYYNRALSIYDEQNQDIYLVYILKDIALLMEETGEIDSAIAYLERASNVCDKLEINTDSSSISFKLGQLYDKKNNFMYAKEKYHEAYYRVLEEKKIENTHSSEMLSLHYEIEIKRIESDIYSRHALEIQQQNKEIENAYEQISHLATHDPLTGCGNRQLLFEILFQSIAVARRNNNLIILITLDIDSFGTINSTYGTEAGDNVLIKTAERLKSVIRDSDFLARIGDDEFGIIINEVKNHECIAAILEKIQSSLRLSIEINEYSFHPKINFGYAIYPDDGIKVETLLSYASTILHNQNKS